VPLGQLEVKLGKRRKDVEPEGRSLGTQSISSLQQLSSSHNINTEKAAKDSPEDGNGQIVP
jgi:hypothetical protein